MRTMVLIFWHPVPHVECDTRPRVVYRDEVKPKYFKVEIYLWLATVTWMKISISFIQIHKFIT